jgi:hypothetical protein
MPTRSENEELAKIVLEQLSYDPIEGKIIWIKSWWKSRVGKIAGCHNSKGYLRINVALRNMAGSRIAWLLHHGRWPQGHIDHIDGNPSNNKLSNLRDVPMYVNAQNQRHPPKHNTSGYLGVSWSKARKKWMAQIRVKSVKTICIGYFDDPLEAHKAYVLKKRELHEGCTL